MRARTRSSCRSATTAALYTREAYDEAVREREQLRRDLRRAPRGARVRPRRVPRAAGVRARARHHLLRDRLRLRAAPTSSPELDMPAYKIASGDLTNTPLLRHVAQIGKPVIFSHRRRHDRRRAPRAYDTIAAENDQVAVLQCTAGYPAEWDELDLRVIETYRERVPRRGRRLLEPRQRHRDGGRRLRARRADRREALHAQPGDEGDRPRLLARAAGPAQAGARPAAHAGRARRRRRRTCYASEVAPRDQDGQEARRRPRPARRPRARATSDIAFKSPGDGLPPYELDRVLGATLRQPVLEDDDAHVRAARGRPRDPVAGVPRPAHDA